MKRFWLFGGASYYPAGGMNDFQKQFTNLEDALEFVRTHHANAEWWELFDSETSTSTEISRTGKAGRTTEILS